MNHVQIILTQVKEMGGHLERNGDKVRIVTPAGRYPSPGLCELIRDHKPELLNHLASREKVTLEEYEGLTPEQRQFYQPATGQKQTLTWGESGRLMREGATFPEPGSFEAEADRLLLESTKRIAEAWPEGFDLDTNPRWQRADNELHRAYHSGDPEKLRIILELREKLALKLFEAYRKERAA